MKIRIRSVVLVPAALFRVLSTRAWCAANSLRTIGRNLLAAAALAMATGAHGAAAPDGQITWGVHISLAPTWFDPAGAVAEHRSAGCQHRGVGVVADVGDGEHHHVGAGVLSLQGLRHDEALLGKELVIQKRGDIASR